MELLNDYYVYRASADRAAELRREADAYRLTRVLADQHAARFPKARKLGAGLIGLAAPAASRRRASAPKPCTC